MASVLFVIRVRCENRASLNELKSKLEDGTIDTLNESIELEINEDKNDESTCINDGQVKEPSMPDVEFASPTTTLEVLQNVLESCHIQGDTWQVTKDKKFHQVMFLEESGDKVDNILNKLTNAGIGIKRGSSVSVIQTSVHIGQLRQEGKITLPSKTMENDENSEDDIHLLIKPKRSSKEAFIKSIKSKLTVGQVVEAVKTQARLTFDYLMFTFLASFIAAVGLVEDNSVVLVASILVSPLMGPILGITFGNQIKNTELRKMGLKTELCGLITAVLVGFLFGFICGPFALDGMGWDSNQTSWPTKEMASRGMLRGWWVGVLIALPSGAGVALSVLGGNAGSLVGVAISASLLAPAVNSGMLWAYSIVCVIKHPTLEMNSTRVTNQELECPLFKDNSYKPVYSCNMAEEAAIMAAVSLVLTIINIVCILITGTLVLKLKEVAPGTSSSNATQTFWTKDVKVAREAYETLKGDTAVTLKDTFLKEWKKVRHNNEEEPQILNEPQTPAFELLGLVQGVEEDPSFQNIVTRAPLGHQKIHALSRTLMKQLSQENALDDETMTIHPLHVTIPGPYTMHNVTGLRRRRIDTIFEEQDEQEKTAEPEKTVKGREFLVTETEKPHHTSIVTVRPPTKDTEQYSVLTESGV